ncbi:uncharacterized protein ACMZJ9_004521, partial [Mantella aurantiaca]
MEKCEVNVMKISADKESATQLDELISVPGEDIVIPCHYSKMMGSVQEVSWYRVNSNLQLCTTESKVYTWNKQHQDGQYVLANFPQDASLDIRYINNENDGGYCCAVTNTTTREIIISKQVTKLLVADQQDAQSTHEITVQKGGSVNLTCTHNLFTRYRESDVLRVNVYWRVGSVTGPYAYHPYQEMVHSSYMNRTNITGVANLHIKGVQTEDNTTFHCFVVIKMCKDDREHEDEIVYGAEVKLNVKGCTSPEEHSVTTERAHSTTGSITTHGISPTEGSAAQKGLPPYVIIIIIAVIILIIIIILILIILKVKGALCKRKINNSEQQMNNIQAADDGSST